MNWRPTGKITAKSAKTNTFRINNVSAGIFRILCRNSGISKKASSFFVTGLIIGVTHNILNRIPGTKEIMSHNLYDNQHDHQNNANPYAYHEAAGEVADDLSDDLSDEASLAYLLYTARIKDTCRGLALAMVFPSMLTSFLVIAPLARAIDNGVSLSGFFRYAIFVVSLSAEFPA